MTLAITIFCAYLAGWCSRAALTSYRRHRQFLRISDEVSKRRNTDNLETHPIRKQRP